MVNISHIEKDIVLNWLCTNTEYNANDILPNIDFDSLRKILLYFVRKGLIESTDIRRTQPQYYIYVNVEAFDLFNHGGFTGVEFLLKKIFINFNLSLKSFNLHFLKK